MKADSQHLLLITTTLRELETLECLMLDAIWATKLHDQTTLKKNVKKFTECIKNLKNNAILEF